MGQPVLVTIGDEFTDAQRVEILERTFTDATTELHRKNIELRKELEELRKALANVRAELRADLDELSSKFADHNRYGDFCPHTGR